MDMTMGSAVPDWLTPVAWTYLALSLLSVAFIAVDIFGRRHRHGSVATELVWVASGLYLGPFAVALYLRQGRATAPTPGAAGADEGEPDGSAVAVLPGGAASAVAHVIAVPLVVAAGWTIAGLSMWPMIIVIAVLAVIMLAVYERVASQGARSRRTAGLSIGAAIVAAVITVAAFDIGMVGWMLLLHYNDAMPPAGDSTFWFLMQLGVVIGLVTAYPTVRWLLRRDQSVVPS